MSTYTVKPGGGGDFSTLQLALASSTVLDDATGPVVIECHAGNAGLFLKATSWGTSSLPINIVAADAARHDGTGSTPGTAYCGGGVMGSFPRSISFRKMLCLSPLLFQGNTQPAGKSLVVEVSECFVYGVPDLSYAITFQSPDGVSDSNGDYEFRCCHNTTFVEFEVFNGHIGMIFPSLANPGDSMVCTVTCANNSCFTDEATASVNNGIVIDVVTGTGTYIDGGSVIANNCVLSGGTDFTIDATFSGATRTSNSSNDATAPGSSSLTSQGSTDMWADAINRDFTANGNALDSGYDANTNGFPVDAEDQIGTSRPQGSAWDRGSIELIVAASGGGGLVKGIIGSGNL